MYLADACALVAYFGAASTGMSAAGEAAMQSDVAVASVTVWELTRKAAIGKLPPLPTEQGSFSRYLRTLGFQSAPLLWEDAEAANRLPMHHKDPMDRMLIATAIRTGVAIITSDLIFPAYGVRTVW
jgi:PIN domain nuclease of toxin-antitoxin system